MIKPDQLKSFDWQTLQADFISKAPRKTLQSVLDNVQALRFYV